MRHINFLLLVFASMLLLSCLKVDDFKTGDYSPSINTSEDITLEINRFTNIFIKYSNTIDTTKNGEVLSSAIQSYTSIYDQLPVLKEVVKSVSTNAEWPWGLSETSASYHKLVASQKIAVIDSIILANRIYNNSLKEIKTLKGDSLVLLYNSSKDFLANPSFSGTSFDAVSSKYVKLKKSALIEQISYIQNHEKKASVFALLNNLANVNKVWQFSNATTGSFILMSDLELLAEDSAKIQQYFKAVSTIDNAETLYNTYYLKSNINPITNTRITYSMLTNFATLEKGIIEAAKINSNVWQYIEHLQDSIELVKTKKQEIITLLPTSELQTTYIDAYETYFPQLVGSLKASFYFSAHITTIINWADRLESLKQTAQPLYTTYANSDTIIGTDRQAVIEIGNERNSLISEYLDNNYQSFFGYTYSALIDPLNVSTIGGKISFLVDLIEN